MITLSDPDGRPALALDTSGLTERQLAVYLQIWDEIQENAIVPSLRELCKVFQIRSPNGIHCHLKALQRKKWITWEPHRARSIRLLPQRWVVLEGNE